MKQLLFHSTRPPLIVNTVTADQKHADNTQSLMPTLFVSLHYLRFILVVIAVMAIAFVLSAMLANTYRKHFVTMPP